MLRALRDRLRMRSLAFTARRAAAGTYETIRQAVIASRASSPEEVEDRILSRLATRRSWRRTSENSFSVHWMNNERVISIERPLNIASFFRDVAEAEIAVFSAGATAAELETLQELGRTELRRLFERDNLPWT